MTNIPDQFERMQLIMADSAVNSIVDASVNSSLTNTREVFIQFLQAALAVDPLTHYVRGLDSYTDYMQKRSKHMPITKGKWTRTVNFNSANDEEIKR